MPDTPGKIETLSERSERAKALVQLLASQPRFAGSEAERAARSHCESRLRELGFEVSEERFSYSQFPARFGPFVCGLIFAAGVLLAGHLSAAHGMPVAGLLVAFGSLAVAGLIGRALLERTGSISLMRSDASNLVAMRRGSQETPRLWLVAHTDSKSQTIGMLVRVASVMVTSVLLGVLVVTMILQIAGLPDSTEFTPQMLRIQAGIASFLTAVAILPVVLSFLTNESRGALDNATGVAAVLCAIEEIRPEIQLGVLLTSAEEIGLAGARAFVSGRRDKGVAINCDTIDNAGRFVCMSGNLRRSDSIALANAGSRMGVKVHLRRTIPGILTDSIAFTRAGWASSTLSRGNLATLARVHTSRDEPGRIDGAGVALAARILAATIEELS